MSETFRARGTDYKILRQVSADLPVYPYLRSPDGEEIMTCISPIHGRSYVVGKNSERRYIVSKGNGLSYTQYEWLRMDNLCIDVWGLLLKQDAIRDFDMGNEIAALGIKTNRMEYVLELNEVVQISETRLLRPVLLQYNVECPYRICDTSFMEHQQLTTEVNKWEKLNDKGYDESYMIAANVLIKNLRILHDNNVLHNAITNQNYTWALELLDFELACSPRHPYDSEDDRRHVKDLFPREIQQTYEIINYISWCLGERIDFKRVDDLFAEYGFYLSTYKL